MENVIETLKNLVSDVQHQLCLDGHSELVEDLDLLQMYLSHNSAVYELSQEDIEERRKYHYEKSKKA